MIKTQIYLTLDEKQQLLKLSQELGLHQSALIREAIDQFLYNKLREKGKKRTAVQAASGLSEMIYPIFLN